MPHDETGNAILKTRDSTVYVGGFIEGMFSGFGTLYHHKNTSTKSFVGSWADGVRHGKGKSYSNVNGRVAYDGDWLGDKRHGRGISTSDMDMGYNGWESRSYVAYDGDWLDDMRHGRGKTFSNHTKKEINDGNWTRDSFISDIRDMDSLQGIQACRQDTVQNGLSLKGRSWFTFGERERKDEGRVTRVDLTGYHLKSVPLELAWDFSALIELNLSENELTSLPVDLSGLTALKNLNLGRNKLTSLPAGIGMLTALRQLNLEFNALTSLPAEMGLLTAMTHLSLYVNTSEVINFDHWGGRGKKIALAALAGIARTTLSLQRVPAELGRLTALRNLDLRLSGLTRMPVEWEKGGRLGGRMPVEWEKGGRLERSGCSIGRL
jgi:hypothetical protein